MRAVLILPVLALAGCGGGGLDTHEACVDAEIEAMRDFTAILEGIRDRRGVEAARPRMEAVVRRVEEIQAAQRKLGEPGADEKARLRAKSDAVQRELDPRTRKAMEALQHDPEAMAALNAVMEEFGPRIAR